MLPQTALLFLLNALLPELQSVEIHYCFTSGSTGCDNYKFGGNSTHNATIYLNTTDRIDTEVLRIKCSSSRPVRLVPQMEKFRLLAMPPGYSKSPVVALNDLKEADSRGKLDIGANGQLVHSQWLDIHLSQAYAVEGLIQCQDIDQKTSNSTVEQARLFISLVKPFNPFWGTVHLVQIYRPNVEDAIYQTVPCRVFGLDPTTLKTIKLYKRRRWMLLTNSNAQRSLDQMNNADECLEDVGRTLALLEELGNGSMEDKVKYLRDKWPRSDCNSDGLLTCTDAHLFAFSQTQIFCEYSSFGSVLREAALSLQIALTRTVMKSENVVLAKASYNPTQGFVLHEPIDYQSEYVCSYEYQSDEVPSAVYMPASAEINEHVQLGRHASEMKGPRTFYCEFAGNASYETASVKFVMQDCNSLGKCDAAYRQPLVADETSNGNDQTANFKIVNASESSRIEIKSHLKSGILACTGVAFFTPENHLHKFEKFDHIFSGVDSKQYLASFYPNHSIIQLNQSIGARNLLAGELVEFKCVLSRFILYPNVTFTLVYDDDTTLELTTATNDQEFEQLAISIEGPVKLENQITAVTLTFKCSERHKGVICAAPFMQKAEHVESFVSFTVVPAETGSPGATVAIVIAAVVFAIMAIALIYFVCQYKRNSGIQRSLTSDEIEEFRNGDKNIKRNEPDGSVNVKGIGFPLDLQISPEDLTLDKASVLGEGHYGRCIRGNHQDKAVAVKMSKSSDVGVFKDFLNEIKIMAYVGTHENIVEFVGAVVEDIQKGVCYAVVELSPYGNLLQLLRKSAEQNGSLEQNLSRVSNSRSESPLAKLTYVHLVGFCMDIAAGMEFLVSKSVVHGDLAARNILIFGNLTAKISDFGLSRKLYGKEYLKKSKQAVPWRWMAIESLEYLRFSHQSDMWSFGVTVWEVVSFGRVPFAGLTWTAEFLTELKRGLRPYKPAAISEKMFEFMSKCWRVEPETRPSFSTAVAFFEEQIRSLDGRSYLNIPS